ncbi:Mu transposase domain-containing protein [Rhodococcus opacus]|uniref:Mu transposase domain-containing protein n=1 Tax=Rhodococcus opacus TaxID=37919 RepID=UPI003D7A8526
MVFGTQAQEAFFEGHARAFEWFGGVPHRIRYDNLKPAVVRVLRGRDRVESDRFVALRSHYGFDSFFCIPGRGGAHEKGGVEGEIGRFRRRHLVPVPKAASLTELNEKVAAADLLDDTRAIGGRPVTVAVAFADEQPVLLGLPAEPFDCARLLYARVDTHARVSVRQNFYSVAAHYAGRRLPVRLSASRVEVLDGSRMVAGHDRAFGRFTDVLTLDHYLEVLIRKPGAPRGDRVGAGQGRRGVHRQPPAVLGHRPQPARRPRRHPRPDRRAARAPQPGARSTAPGPRPVHRDRVHRSSTRPHRCPPAGPHRFHPRGPDRGAHPLRPSRSVVDRLRHLLTGS